MYDVIVVGARCAGSPIALLLSRKGYRVLLLDKDTFPSDMPMSTHIIHQRGVACLARWGLRDQVVATDCLPITRGRLDFGPVTLAGSYPAVEGETDAFAPRRILLDEILVRAAMESGAEFREECRVQHLLTEDGCVTGVTGVSPSGQTFSEKARIVIGADGPSSRVASEAGASEYNAKPALQGTAWIYWQDMSLDDLEYHLRDYEALYALPSSNHTTLVGANWSIDRFRNARRDIESSYFDLLRRVAPELADRVTQTQRADEKIYLGSTRNFFRKACGPGWALLGDAHYKKDPCTAQGITDAFCDAERLADAVDEGLSGKRDLLEVLEEHEQATVARAMPFYEFTCEMATFAPPPPEQLSLFEALQGNASDIDAFFGLVTTAVSPVEFFAPGNIDRILESKAKESA